MTDLELLQKAWEAREKAYPWKSGTKVGCAIETESGDVIVGWNIEGLWQTSIHAEVCAITQLQGRKGIKVAIVANTEFFTPCGACIDWLMQFCKKVTVVVIQNKRREINKFFLTELAPHYPCQ